MEDQCKEAKGTYDEELAAEVVDVATPALFAFFSVN